MTRVRRIEFEDVGFRKASAMIYEYSEEYFRDIAKSTTKPILERLKAVYEKHGKRHPWNAFVAIGMKIYSMARRGYDLDYYRVARDMARKWGIPEPVAREIVEAVLAEARKA